MKKILLLLIVVLFSTYIVNAQTSKSAKEFVFFKVSTDFKKAQTVKLCKEFNKNLEEVLDEYWNLDIPYKIMERQEAFKYMKKNPDVCLGIYTHHFGYKDYFGENNNRLDIVQGKMIPIITIHLGDFVGMQDDGSISLGLRKTDLAFSIMQAQFLYANYPNMARMVQPHAKKLSLELAKLYGHLLKSKPLLISESYLSKRLNAKDVKAAYPFECQVVAQSELDAAILDKSEDVLVLYRANLEGTYGDSSYWYIYQPSDGTIVYRKPGVEKLTKDDLSKIAKKIK